MNEEIDGRKPEAGRSRHSQPKQSGNAARPTSNQNLQQTAQLPPQYPQQCETQISGMRGGSAPEMLMIKEMKNDISELRDTLLDIQFTPPLRHHTSCAPIVTPQLRLKWIVKRAKEMQGLVQAATPREPPMAGAEAERAGNFIADLLDMDAELIACEQEAAQLMTIAEEEDDDDNWFWKLCAWFNAEGPLQIPIPEPIRACCCANKRTEVSIEKYRFEWPTAPGYGQNELPVASAGQFGSVAAQSSTDAQRPATDVSKARIVFGSSLSSEDHPAVASSTPKWMSLIPTLSLATAVPRQDMATCERTRYAHTERSSQQERYGSAVRSQSEQRSRSSSALSSSITASSMASCLATPCPSRSRGGYSPARRIEASGQSLQFGKKAQEWLASQGVPLSALPGGVGNAASTRGTNEAVCERWR